MRAYSRLMHKMFIGNIEKGCIIPGFRRPFLPRDLIFPVAALTPEFEAFHPIVQGGEVLSQYCPAAAWSWALDGIFLKSFEE
jgi:hypothetical protein